MRIKIAVPEAFAAPDVIDAALEAVTRLDEHMIRAGQSPTSHALIAAGARWRPEDPGDEHFDHGGTIAKRGHGDCDDWAPLHAATLRASGEDPGARAIVRASGPSTYHAIVERSDGAIDDPSIAAGMKAARVVGADVDPDRIQIWACDPHDGRVYQGQLIPTVAPLSLHCGPGIALRSSTLLGPRGSIVGTLWEGRCDLPLSGSPLVQVQSYWRRGTRRRARGGVAGATTVVGGAVPYALSCTSYGTHAGQALSDAIVGAILCGDAAELSTALDRYKLIATQLALAHLTPGQVHDALVQQITADLHAHHAATGVHPSEHTERMLEQLAREGIATHGGIVGGFFDDIGKIASGVVHAVSDVANTVAQAAGSIPWGDIVHGVEAAVSVVPGLGTAVSDVIAAAETAYDAAAAALHGNPLEAGIHAAYNFALASVPGAASLRPALDPVVDTIINLAAGHEPIDSAVLDRLLRQVPDQPQIASLSPRSVAASLAHLAVSHLGVKNTSGRPAQQQPLAPFVPNQGGLDAVAAIQKRIAQERAGARANLIFGHKTQAQRAAAPKPPSAPLRIALKAPTPTKAKAPPPSAVKPPGVPHAAVHVTQVRPPPPPPPRPPPHPGGPVAHAPPPRLPGSPGAPPGATHWTCTPGPGGLYQCRWV